MKGGSANIPNIELVVEVRSSFTKRLRNFFVKCQGTLDDVSTHSGHQCAEGLAFHMPVEKGFVDGQEGRGAGHVDCEGCEVPLKASVYSE